MTESNKRIIQEAVEPQRGLFLQRRAREPRTAVKANV